MNRTAFFFYGPTAVGKSDIAVDVARLVNAEIINMDVGQFYTPFSIGTAKPQWQESDVPHHFFDILNTPSHLTVVEYRRGAEILCNQLWLQGKIPFFVGGSGFYLHSLLFPIFEHSPIAEKKIDLVAENYSWDFLASLDPKRAKVLHKNDTYRIARACALLMEKRLPSAVIPVYNPLFDFRIFFLSRDRNVLYERIKKRIHNMIASGWLDEIEAIIGTCWEKFVIEKKLIGYNELLSYLVGIEKIDLQSILNSIGQRTCHYAKRQLTFWRSLEKKIIAADSQGREKIKIIDLMQKSDTDIVSDLTQYILR